ncbi:MAG: glycosyltransferase family 2 protein [Verrucomicrobiales bacterium]|jgi:glycosyltransferase involved in cell wall biosynthesis|nr:glycosyltransferase family 2 protein [Verrucomicrobiales bacterium]
MNISVCLTTLNAEPSLARCLQSVRGIADEIVIIDNGSSDRTPFIATDFNARFIRNPDNANGNALALQKATRDWVLFLDANDELSAELQQSLSAVKNGTPAVSGYQLNQVRNFGGQLVRFGKNYPNLQLRLVEKAKAQFDANHQLTVSGSTQPLDGELIQHANSKLLQNPPPYSLIGALQNHLFKGGISQGGFGWQISRLDAKK